MERDKLTLHSLNTAINLLGDRLIYALNKHKDGCHVSFHETLGDLTEEYHEFIDEVKGEDDYSKVKELADIAVASIWGIASYYENSQKILKD